jgi:hypothetical protein
MLKLTVKQAKSRIETLTRMLVSLQAENRKNTNCMRKIGVEIDKLSNYVSDKESMPRPNYRIKHASAWN